ncbi:MAG: CDP-alcohol phosphatidyltransferase family protein, partial [Candidatus Jordarchaeales archaeon]
MLGRLKELLTAFFNPVAFFLIRLGITPNIVTVLGLLLSVFSALFIVGGRLDPLFHVDEANRLVIASILLLSSGFCDLLDGLVARMGSMVTAFGGFFDSILDRYSEVVFLVTLIYMNYCSALWGLLALSGSLLVSYERA